MRLALVNATQIQLLDSNAHRAAAEEMAVGIQMATGGQRLVVFVGKMAGTFSGNLMAWLLNALTVPADGHELFPLRDENQLDRMTATLEAEWKRRNEFPPATALVVIDTGEATSATS